jgi:hypothetical protein
LKVNAMFLKQYEGWHLQNSLTKTLKCTHCGNTTDHFVYVAPHGIQVGLIFMSKPVLGMRKYFLACPTCDHLTRELTKEQAQTLVRN